MLCFLCVCLHRHCRYAFHCNVWLRNVYLGISVAITAGMLLTLFMDLSMPTRKRIFVGSVVYAVIPFANFLYMFKNMWDEHPVAREAAVHVAVLLVLYAVAFLFYQSKARSSPLSSLR